MTNTFGVPGVDEHCFYMKSAEDAKALRERINACFELANLPETTDEERRRLLNFVVVRSWPAVHASIAVDTPGELKAANVSPFTECLRILCSERLRSVAQVGGGPTGTELAAEMNDLVRPLSQSSPHLPIGPLVLHKEHFTIHLLSPRIHVSWAWEVVFLCSTSTSNLQCTRGL